MKTALLVDRLIETESGRLKNDPMFRPQNRILRKMNPNLARTAHSSDESGPRSSSLAGELCSEADFQVQLIVIR
jgi:hypothetical protein